MSEDKLADFGMIGLAVMGRNLAFNILDNGFTVAGWNREPELTASAVEESGGRLIATESLEALVKQVKRPRRIMMMIMAGAPVDSVLEQLKPLLDPGDIVIDGGNSLFRDTERRSKFADDAGFNFIGVGVSGGEEGARKGPSLMPGGNREAYDHLQPVFEAIAAKTDSGPCVTYVGRGGAGHFVKMVHNGIEYADMQFIAEVYQIMRDILGYQPEQIADVFDRWNNSALESFLIEITSQIFRVKDDKADGYLVDRVLDKAGQKGTGRWTVQLAVELGVAVPSIAAAVDARVLSSQKEERVAASKHLNGPSPSKVDDVKAVEAALENALYAAKLSAYAQGMDLIYQGSKKFDWGVNLSEVARIWKGGCIIRARYLDTIRAAFAESPDLPNLFCDPATGKAIDAAQKDWREVIALAQKHGVPVGGLASGLAYYDAYRTAALPQNLTQAQRDAFGAHTYRRTDTDESESFHSDWLGTND